MVKQLPNQYMFFLVPCYTSGCPHPVCQGGRPTSVPTWFEGGPPVTYLPLPVPDKGRPWGQQCNACSTCYGHYLDPKQACNTPNSIPTSPPSATISDLFKAQDTKPSQQQIKVTAEQVLLSPADVEMWLDHMSTVQLNRKRGAAKAAATKRKKKQGKPSEPVLPPSEKDTYRCGVCSEECGDETVEEELWIQCEKCLSWFHGDCVGVNPSRVPEIFSCQSCFSHK